MRAPALVHRELEMTAGLIRDLFTEDVDEVVIDDKESFAEIQAYLKPVSPELRDRVKLYKGREPIFDAYGIEPQIEKTFERKVWLKKGGYICIDHAEALVAIDVNTGRFTGKKNQEETIFRTNMEAAKEIPRQLRLRDIGGIIVIDFIDMEIEANKRAVLDELRKELRKDRARTKAFAVSDLGPGRDDAPARALEPAPLLHRGLPALRRPRQGAVARDHAGQARARRCGAWPRSGDRSASPSRCRPRWRSTSSSRRGGASPSSRSASSSRWTSRTTRSSSAAR